MISLSKEVEEAMWGDEAILRYLDLGRQHFEAGDPGALMGVLFLCARFQAVIPEWAADALLDIEDRLNAGGLTDFNEAFGWGGANKATRRATARQAHVRVEVLGELQAARLAGASLGPDDIFDVVRGKLAARGVQVSRRDIEAIYKEHGQFVKTLPREPEPHDVYGQVHLSIPRARRKGRSILSDAKK
ncbi:hypothetical protein [Ralstonia mojiangensis]|uniref:hypothetical protein n=1 Tax=Ralstonia mojiangensis TaxID=2953895 RepID=UPI0020910D60|nr:hypothetical protein [Ralstonia mojiangensis]MCO5411120.1 hypothetical protein [Ralstonia mojiangensis]